ncbi:MAG: three-Cys-motif partner protein TcmP [Betaproteobacteria bacterium]|nr:three-Cys-motif partner protein TcmP [Betaproteobacteria bacterium]
MVAHRFGGAWTERKLSALRDYLAQYQKIFTTNPNARKLKTIYVDAFAGTGDRDTGEDLRQGLLFGYDDETQGYQEGSVKVALSLSQSFHQYVFIDNKAKHANALHNLVNSEFPNLANRCTIEKSDANIWLQEWCRTQNWRDQRAVAFLDPYGMDVEWGTIVAIANTKAIDLWVLFPLGIGPSRVLPNQEIPESKWADRLTKLFGTDEWKSQFYRENGHVDLLGNKHDSITRIAGVDEILAFFLKRLNLVFERIVERPMILRNSKQSPMYALCFAAGNPRGAPTAVRIASHLVQD